MGGRAPLAEASRRAEDALAALGLSHRVDAFPEQMSGGEQQRVAVARALVREPKLILADEPTASLDDVSANIVKEAIREAARRLSCAVLLVTHDHDLVDEVATRIWHFENGQIEDFKGPYAEYLTQKETSVA